MDDDYVDGERVHIINGSYIHGGYCEQNIHVPSFDTCTTASISFGITKLIHDHYLNRTSTAWTLSSFKTFQMSIYDGLCRAKPDRPIRLIDFDEHKVGKVSLTSTDFGT